MPAVRPLPKGRASARWRLAALVALLVPLLLAPARPSPALALAAPAMLPGTRVELRASGEQVATFVPPPDALGGPRIAATTFSVSYSGFTPQAQAAFQRAVDIWSSLLTSPVPIRVQAEWKPLSAGVLGSAGPVNFWRDFPGATRTGTWYPVALANKLAGDDLDSTSDDIAASFNSDFAATFYFGSGATPANQINFTSVVLHELGHGLGFSGSMRVAAGSGNWGGNSGFPFIYDRFAEHGAGQALLDTARYPNPSTQLAGALQSGDVWFAGPLALAAAGGTRPKLYAPAAWQQGSSYSHLDEATYGPGNANSLMTPQIANGETIYAPGSVALGLLEDLGWGPVGAGGGVALTVTTSGGGSVARNPAGTGNGPFAYPTGTPLTLTPQPGAGHSFVGWAVDGAYRGWAASLTVTMGATHTVQATFAPTKTFPDVTDDRADYGAIVALASRGSILGYDNRTYAPDDGVQRAQVAALIARAMPNGPGTPPTTTMPPACVVAATWDCEDWGNNFQDRGGLDPNLWRNVGTLQHYAVAQGYAAADCAARGLAAPCFGPNDPVSYVETVTFITRAMIAKGYWQSQPGAPQPYAGVPPVFAASVATFHFYTKGLGGIPAPPPNWNAQARRGWFARALWPALDSYWGTDAPGLGGYVP